MISCLWLVFVGFCSKRCCLSKVNKQSTLLCLRMDESKEYLLDNRDNFSMCRESKIFLANLGVRGCIQRVSFKLVLESGMYIQLILYYNLPGGRRLGEILSDHTSILL